MLLATAAPSDDSAPVLSVGEALSELVPEALLLSLSELEPERVGRGPEAVASKPETLTPVGMAPG